MIEPCEQHRLLSTMRPVRKGVIATCLNCRWLETACLTRQRGGVIRSSRVTGMSADYNDCGERSVHDRFVGSIETCPH